MLHSSYTVLDSLMIFGGVIYQVKMVCLMQECLLSLDSCLSYLP